MLGNGLESATTSTGISNRDIRLRKMETGLHSFPMGHVSAVFSGTVNPESRTSIRCPACWTIRFGSVRLLLVVASHGSFVFVLNSSQHTLSCPLLQGLACGLLGPISRHKWSVNHSNDKSTSPSIQAMSTGLALLMTKANRHQRASSGSRFFDTIVPISRLVPKKQTAFVRMKNTRYQATEVCSSPLGRPRLHSDKIYITPGR